MASSMASLAWVYSRSACRNCLLTAARSARSTARRTRASGLCSRKRIASIFCWSDHSLMPSDAAITKAMARSNFACVEILKIMLEIVTQSAPHDQRQTKVFWFLGP